MKKFVFRLKIIRAYLSVLVMPKCLRAGFVEAIELALDFGLRDISTHQLLMYDILTTSGKCRKNSREMFARKIYE